VKKAIALLVVLLCTSLGAWGQVLELGMFAGASKLQDGVIGSDTISSNATAASKIRLTDGFQFGFRFGFNPYRFLGAEFGYAYNRTQLHLDGPPVSEQGMAIHQGFGDALFHFTKEGSRIRPFVAGGIQFSNFVPPGASVASGGGDTKFGVNYGGGVKVKLTENWQIRLDIRQFESGKPFKLANQTGLLLQNEISAGVAFTL
jgi:opacity protein-like surface antigen